MQSDKQAVCFPGQGAHNAQMLDKYAGFSDFASHYQIICDALGFAPLKAIENDPELVNTNAISSMLTVLASRLAFMRYLESGQSVDFLTGYSVGQYTALHFAGCFDFETLIKIISVRTKLMDRCFEEKPGSMIAIAGIPQARVEELLNTLNAEGWKIWISNYNCVGQYSIAGEKQAVVETLKRAVSLDPKRLVELPVGGAWHCPMLEGASEEFRSFLAGVEFTQPKLPVINNVTGDFMPDSLEVVKQELVKHLSHPVLWEQGIRTLISRGCNLFTEVGYGNVLTKFGFFIDRHLNFKSFSAEEQTICAE